MEFLDEDARPRFRPVSSLLSSAPPIAQKPISKIFLIITISLSPLLLVLSILFIQTEPYRSLLIWLAFSLFLGPFAPSHLTGGDIRVGRGPILEPAPIEQEPDLSAEKQGRKRRSLRPVRLDGIPQNPIPIAGKSNGLSVEGKLEALARNVNGSVRIEEEKEWNVEDMEILKKQMVKNPVGKPRRWEVIAEAFNGRHRVENVVKMSKELGEKKSSDSFAQFLKNRKPMDSRIQGESEGIETGESKKDSGSDGDGDGVLEWSSGEDIALLNALKVFPKDVAMRWEKISAAVPGKSKAACMKRVAVLKKDFRSSKAGAES